MLWIKAFHIIFMVTWFAGLFYLPRLFVYHAMSRDELSHDRFIVMERKLFIIMTIGALITAGFGIWLLLNNFTILPQWMIAKLVILLLLIIYHLYCYKIMQRFRHKENARSHVFYRWFNEAPVILLIAIVCLAVAKPF
ncbi:Protoporphyrinogen IX oxidase, novel form, HemJ [hydrothermal vent metagenome]|uniref:Protoporphyrinogen IX oxidase, novel form, HemJ n=1 Tax=hydrothermal vent metagenome TaxID=652676 RepID=A0A3B0Y4A4_9ZZZZ